MASNRTWPLLALGGISALAAAFIWGYAPRRARKLSAIHAKFRGDFQPTHDAIDAQYHHHDRVVDGICWHYVEEGAPEGPIILFLHGLPEGWYSWHEVLARVDHAYRLIAIDMKGYGRSDLTDLDYDWHHVAGQIADLMASLDIEQYYVVSHDWGSIIGSVLVGDHPDHILGYVRMEADLIPRETGVDRAAAYFKKPQWLLFRSTWLATYLMRDAGRFIDRVYGSRTTTQLKQVDRDYLVYEFSRPGVAEMNPLLFRASSRTWTPLSARFAGTRSPSRCCSCRPTVTRLSRRLSLPTWARAARTSNWSGSRVPATSTSSISPPKWQMLSTGPCTPKPGRLKRLRKGRVSAQRR